MEAIKKIALLAALAAWGCASLFFVLGETAEGSAMSIGEVVAIKAFALLSLCACANAFRKAEKAGMMPDFWYKLEKGI